MWKERRLLLNFAYCEKEPKEVKDRKRNTLRGVDERRIENKIKENRKGILGSCRWKERNPR
jgi:hypothetical protein